MSISAIIQRKAFISDVIESSNTDRAFYSSRHDFTTGPLIPITGALCEVRKPLPYALHISRARSVYVAGLDSDAAREAPFFYLYARRNTKQVLSIPWEAGPIIPSKAGAYPVFCFSPGRCGSTLLSKLLGAAGIKGISEPDFYLALKSNAYNEHVWLRPLLRKVVANLSRDLVSGLADAYGPLIVKLRSDSCASVKGILDCVSEPPKTLFLCREFDTWAASKAQAHRAFPESLVKDYRDALRCYDYLQRHSHCHLVKYEEILLNPVGVCGAIAKFLGLPVSISEDRLQEVMSEDSQAGTPMARRAEAKSHWEEIKTETLDSWRISELPARWRDLQRRGNAPP
jgi:hypothetical protein